MTKKDKELLLKDLCARLPYGVKICIYDFTDEVYDEIITIKNFSWIVVTFTLGAIKPYLRPMSSMTEEEKELMKGSVICFNELEGNSTLFDEIGLDWLNAHHFDYRGLIEKGLAIEAPEGMYKTE